MVGPAPTLALLLLVQCSIRGGEGSRGRGSPTTTTPAPPPLPGPVDLTFTLDRNATFWPGDQPFTVTRNTSTTGEFGWYSSQSSCSSGEAGTHIAAPYHLNEHGWKVNELPLDRLLVPGVVLDVSAEVARNAGFVLTAEHLAAWEKKHGLPPRNSLLLVNFGVGARARTASSSATPNTTPTTAPAAVAAGVSKEAAAHLVTQGRVVGVGVDLPSLDAPSSRASRGRGEPQHAPASRALHAANIYTVLNLDLRRELPAKGFAVLVLPAKVRGAAVAGARVVATASLPSARTSGAGPGFAPPGMAAILVAALCAVSVTVLTSTTT